MNTPNPVRKTLIPFSCLFLSGMASLTYELIWIKQLTLVFGATLYAVSAVLCAFMIGLSLGAWGISRWLQSQRPDSLVRVYGLLEGGIGLYGLLFPVLLSISAPLYPVLSGIAETSDTFLYFLLFVWGTLLMLPSTFLMGATLPVLGSWAVNQKKDSIHSNISLLYSLNTFGAVAGCVFTQWFAIEWWGVTGATGFAVGLNLLVAGLCFGWNPGEVSEKDKTLPANSPANQTDQLPSKNMGAALLAVFAFSGMVALSSEILWTRILVFPLGSSLYSFALILATFLSGIAAGSLVSRRLLGTRHLIIKFLILEAVIGGVCFLVLPAMELLPSITQWIDLNFYNVANTPGKTLWMRSLIAIGFMLMPTIGFGLLFPLANQIQVLVFGSIPKTLGNTYAINTLGAITGTLVTPFILIPLWGIEGSLFFLNAGLILIATLALGFYSSASLFKRCSGAAIGVFFIIVMAVFHPPGKSSQTLTENNLVRAGLESPDKQLRLLDYTEGNFSTLSVVEETATSNRTLYVDGFSTATVSGRFTGSTYMQAMGYIPMMLHPDPQKALVICFGTGNTLGTVARFPGVQAEGVEIDRNVLSMAHHFKKWNGDVLNRSNVDLKIQDGRNHVRWTKNNYDVITLEPMHPAHAGVNNLYSMEFYEEARKKLNPGGIMMQWLPLHLLSTQDSLAILKTFKQVFPHTTIWNSYLTRIVLLVGSMEPLQLDPEQFRQKLGIPEVAAVGEEIGVRSFGDFMDFYLADVGELQAVLQSAKSITDNRPILEHSSVNLLPPLPRETDETFLNLLRPRLNHFPPLKSVTPEQEQKWKDLYDLRTAQRLSIFSQRYRGPGASAFKDKEFLKGLDAARKFSGQNSSPWITVNDSGWHTGVVPE